MTKNARPIVAIVDDNALVRHATHYALSLKGIFIAFEAENGQECIEKITHSVKKPDIIILDLEMPVMNGFQTAEALKAAWPEIKIIAHSGSDNASVIAESLAAGADYFLSKLEDSSALLDLLDSICQPNSL